MKEKVCNNCFENPWKYGRCNCSDDRKIIEIDICGNCKKMVDEYDNYCSMCGYDLIIDEKV